MTLRAVIIGVFGAVLIAGLGYINDEVMRLNRLVGNHLPVSVFGALIVFVLAINPLLFALRAKWRFQPKELAVAVALTLVGCTIPGSGLMRTFTSSLAMPIHLTRTNPGWEKYEVLGYVPPVMMASGGRYDPDVIGGFVSGLGRKGSFISFGDVPWHAWRDPLMVWVPFIFLAGVAMIAMGFIVHRQWARHERLRYPIAEFATSLMAQDPDRGLGGVFRSKLFWVGLLTVTLIHVVNAIHSWYPESIRIPLRFTFQGIAQQYPGLLTIPGGRMLTQLIIYPSVIGFSFFLASEVSLSMGVSQFLFVALAAALMRAGVDVSETYMSGGVFPWQRFGSYLGIGLVVLYLGRRYYGGVLKQAMTFRRTQGVDASAVWAFRMLLVTVGGMIGLLTAVGLAWCLAVAVVFLILLTGLIIARINTETGLFFCEPIWHPSAVMIGFFGYFALGPTGVAVTCMLSAVFTINAREILTPFVVNGLKMCDTYGVKPARVRWKAVGTFGLALAVAVPIVLWADYNFGVLNRASTWASRHIPTLTFNTVENAAGKLRVAGELEQSENLTSWERLKNIRSDRLFLRSAGLGLAAVLVFSVLRLRFTWWCLHPVLFLVWDTYPIRLMGDSFLLGWVVKTLVVRLGGWPRYRQAKTLMIGVIAGDVFSALIFMIVGASHYALTGLIPEAPYQVFPR